MTSLHRSAALFVAAALLAGTATAEHRKVVDGLEINIGVVPAAQLLKVDAYERSMHPSAAIDATHHVVVSVADARTGAPVGDARVMLELVDPHGGVQRLPLERGEAAGLPDYSGLFRFGWSGDYKLKISVARAGAMPVTSVFSWRQDSY